MVLKREQFNLEQIATKYFGHKELFLFIISILLITDLVILLNIPFMRQIFGFLFLSILPGVLILQILKLDKLEFTEKVVLSIGISVSFLMFFGLLINNLSLSFGYETQLSTIPLLISFNLAFIVLAIIGYTVNKDFSFSLPKLNLNTSEKAFLVLPVLFPALSIFGMHVMNTTDNNIILMCLLFSIAIYVVFVCFFNHKFPKRLYPIVIFLISISLLLLMSLRLNHLLGADIHTEYYFFRTTMGNLHWSVFGHSTLDACLSISLLPTIYQSILNISPEFLFKILYSLIYSISPLVIYVLSKKYVGEFYAFLASCFFMFQQIFVWTEYNARTSIAILFFALVMMTLFNDKIDPLRKRILFIVFMASCIVSHYSTSYIFFFIILGVFLGMEILSRKYSIKKVVSLTMVLLFFAFIFFWYSQVTETAFNKGVGYIENTLSNLNKFFIVESRRDNVQTMFGEGVMQKGIPHKIEFVFTWLTFAFIGIGVITLIRRYKEMSFPELNFKKPDFLKEKFEVGYFMIALACSALLVAFVALPWISTGYGIDRLYAVAITILSVFFVIGGIMLSKLFCFLQKTLLLHKSLYKTFKKSFIKNASQKTCAKRKNNRMFLVKVFTEGKKVVGKSLFSKERFKEENGSQVRAYLIILLVLIPYFLCVTGVMYNIFGFPEAIILNSEGGLYDAWYVHDQESYGARWLRDNGELENTMIYIGGGSGGRLISQAGIRRCDSRSLFEKDKKIDGYIYLRYYNVVDGRILDAQREEHNITEYQDKFVGKNKVYNNGGCEVHT